MNNNIQEDNCSFEVSKLLEQKGFKIQCFSFFDKDGKPGHLTSEYAGDLDGFYHRPTHALAIKWIRENFGISISANREATYKEVYDKYIFKLTQSMNNSAGLSYVSGYYITHEEAIEEALLYTLKYLS